MVSGIRKAVCSFELVMIDEETVDIKKSKINCSKPKKIMKIINFVWRSKTLKIFTLSFNVGKTKTKLQRAEVERGGTVCCLKRSISGVQFPVSLATVQSASLARTLSTPPLSARLSERRKRRRRRKSAAVCPGD